MNQWGVREHFVYWMFDAEGVCLYVGMTRQPEKRWKTHQYEKPVMIARIASKRMAGPYLIETARRIEREEQDRLRPFYDGRVGSPRKYSKHPPCPPIKDNYHPGVAHLRWSRFTAVDLGGGDWQMHHNGEPTVILHESDQDFIDTEWREVPA